MSDRLIIFDTTLRDGEQSPGASMTREEKLRIAKQLEKMRVDVIEAGFPAASNGDFEAVRAIAGTVRDATICALSRSNDRDISRAAEALEPSDNKRLHIFIATSALHMEKKLRMTPEQVQSSSRWRSGLRANSPTMSSSRPRMAAAPMSTLCRVLEGVIKEGATTINIADTVGYAVPERFAELIRTLRTRIPNSDKAVWSVHCHNDLGMAVANSLAGVMAGARQVECTVNGLGERAGNTSLEEIVMAVKTRRDFYKLDVGIDTSQIVPASRLVSGITGFVVQPNKAVVGANAFAHASGIHQDGVLKQRDTYEIMRAEDVGWTTNKIVLGKLSGRTAFKKRLQEIGIELESESAVNEAFQRFKDLADRKVDIFDEDLHALVSEQAHGEAAPDHFRLVSMTQQSASGERPRATVVLSVGGQELTSEGTGSGPVDAVLRAIEERTCSGAEMTLYSVNAISGGTEAQGEVTVRLAKGGRVVNGVGADPDIVLASAKAYLSAVNKLHEPEKVSAQGGI
ncbi:MAG: 2-isopropylmalate synthase [Burkholderiaceae bacterium]